jgi:hypothetical protein
MTFIYLLTTNFNQKTVDPMKIGNIVLEIIMLLLDLNTGTINHKTVAHLLSYF